MRKRCVVFAAAAVVFLLSNAAFGQIHMDFKISGAFTRIPESDIRNDNNLFVQCNGAISMLEKIGDRANVYSGELVTRLSDKFGVGLGFESFSIGFEDKREDYGPSQEYYIGQYSLQNQKLATTSIFLNGYLIFPLFERMTISSFAGVGWYSGNYEANRDDYGSYTEVDPQYFYEEYIATDHISESRLKVDDAGFGFQGGFGVDVKVFSRLNLFFECKYRSVSLSDWEGSSNFESYSFDQLQYWYKQKGSLWILESDENATIPSYLENSIISPLLTVSDGNPVKEYYKSRKAEIDLSGFSFGAGVKISLF